MEGGKAALWDLMITSSLQLQERPKTDKTWQDILEAVIWADSVIDWEIV